MYRWLKGWSFSSGGQAYQKSEWISMDWDWDSSVGKEFAVE